MSFPWFYLIPHGVSVVGGTIHHTSWWKSTTKWEDNTTDLRLSCKSFIPRWMVSLRFLVRRIRLLPDFIEEWNEEINLQKNWTRCDD